MNRTTHRGAVDAIAGWIVSGAHPPGSFLPTEPEIGARLSCSRTIVREAIKTLVAKGLLSSGPRVGTRVLSFDRWHLFDPDVIGWRLQAGVDRDFIRDAVEVRLALEPNAGALAAKRATLGDIAALDRALTELGNSVFGKACDLPAWLEADFAFHKALLAAAHNQFFSGLTPLVEAVLRVSFHFSTASGQSARASLPLHVAVRDAIAARDAKKAHSSLCNLIERARRDIEAALPLHGPASGVRTFRLGDAA
jgi:GntR family galactonate operon transcriptional repressor